jgi:hypothetical protein
MSLSTLLLNADATPISLIPMSVIGWETACKYIYTKHAEPLHFYDDWIVHSQYEEYKVPAVMILKEQVYVKRRLKCETNANADSPASRLVFLRDGYVCQYCSGKFGYKDLTIDHVLPRKNNGKTIWTNVSTACSSCNGRRGHDTRIQPKTKPFRPTYGHLVKMMKRFPMAMPHPTWNYYLGWDEDLVQLVKPQKSVTLQASILEDKRVKLLT